jgi:hypothetical protein
MSGSGISLWLAAAWLSGLALAAAVIGVLLWLRLRRIRLQVEARYLAAVSRRDSSAADASALFGAVRGEPVRRLLRGLIGPGVSVGPASWQSHGWLRYDSDDRERAVSAETYCIPGLWWAQIRRVRLRAFGWIDEIHEVEGDRVSSGYWWLGLYRVDRKGFGPSPLALRAQALGEGVLTPWNWFMQGEIDWESFPATGTWHGRTHAGGNEVQVSLDRSGRPAFLELLARDGRERLRVEYDGWTWADRSLMPERLRLIEAVGSVNEFVRLETWLDAPIRAPTRPETPRS